MRPTRRQFLELAAATGVAAMAPWRNAYAFYQTPTILPLFGTALRGVGPGGIPVAQPDLFGAPTTGAVHYTFNIQKFQDAGVCPSLGPTTLYGYSPAMALGEGGFPTRHLGGVIVAQRGTPIQLTFRNMLPAKHIIPVDTTTNFPDAAVRQNMATTHLHGGFVPWISDGGPDSWFAADGSAFGSSYANVLNPALPANAGEYYYPNDQSARLMWFHDHAHDITRINAYAGIASAYVLRDTFEVHLKNLGLPDFVEVGGNELPLVVQDKIFVGPNIGALDPTWTGSTAPGSLWYAHTYERNRWRASGNLNGGNLVPPDPSCIPEFFGDTMLVNGTVYPRATVEGRRYRLRVLNACNARFLNLQLYMSDPTTLNGITLNAATGNPTNVPFVNRKTGDPLSGQPAVLQIGTEGGFLPRPVAVPTNVPFNPATFGGSLLLAPAERADLIVDFSGYAGQSIILYTDTPAPFPMGVPVNDYFPGWNVKGNPANGLTPNGFGPNTRVLMRFDVVSAASADAPLAIGPGFDLVGEASRTGLVWNDPLPVPSGVTTPPAGVTVRRLSLNETFDVYGRLIQMLGTNIPAGSPSAGLGRPYMAPATETPKAGTTEVWEIYNTTADVHPMHFHLVNVQLINRQPFQVSSFGGGQNLAPNFTGPATPPDPNETGWKETVRMYPGTVTRVIMTFRLPTVPFTVPNSPKGGKEYVWHCHILEHEEHDMMRPLLVI